MHHEIDDFLEVYSCCSVCDIFRGFMYENMDKTSSMLHYLYPLIDKASHKLYTFMMK